MLQPLGPIQFTAITNITVLTTIRAIILIISSITIIYNKAVKAAIVTI